ncbi:hypothetical protein NDU88_007943 [Pleurodeles waltl]|uniref:Uncharacterized protein n=1 Tax=Pleurodeles waltl TaxID=8319 RepID=A0AAV7RWJ3_PLEWA|nr:hypothetical protein NDU88_007943 [Pleurodeles waltl]
MESNRVIQALKVLQEAGREDLIREGVLEQAWRVDVVVQGEVDLPVVSVVRGSGARFLRRSGASLRQRVAAAGRGAVVDMAFQARGRQAGRGTRAHAHVSVFINAHQIAVSASGWRGALDVRARAAKRGRAHKRGMQQAPLALESGGECCEPLLEESPLGGAANMAAPSKGIISGIVGGIRSPFVQEQGDIEWQGVRTS